MPIISNIVCRTTARWRNYFLPIAFGLVASTNIFADEVNSNKHAKLFIQLPSNSNSDITKQTFHLEGFKTLECPLNKNLDSSHPDFIGEFIHIELKSLRHETKKISVSSEHPLMLSASYASKQGDGRSSICYYQSQSFWPQSGKNYLIKFNLDCSVEGFEMLDSGKLKTQKLNNLVDTCFAQKN